MSPSIQREIARIKNLGEKVEIIGNRIIIYNNIIPTSVIEDFIGRIRRVDVMNEYQIEVRRP